MTTSTRVLGTLRVHDGTGIVRLEDRIDTDVDDLWSALTHPARLARWLGEVDGDLGVGVGGEFTAHWFASGWESADRPGGVAPVVPGSGGGTCRVEACEAPHRLRLHTSSPDKPDSVVEVTLTPSGDGTLLAIEDRDLPLDDLAAYGAGDQFHLEDLASYLAGGEPCDARTRW